MVELWKQETSTLLLQASGHEHDWNCLLNIESGLMALHQLDEIHLTTTGISLEMNSQERDIHVVQGYYSRAWQFSSESVKWGLFKKWSGSQRFLWKSSTFIPFQHSKWSLWWIVAWLNGMVFPGYCSEWSTENIKLASKFAIKQRTGNVIFVGLLSCSQGRSRWFWSWLVPEL